MSVMAKPNTILGIINSNSVLVKHSTRVSSKRIILRNDVMRFRIQADWLRKAIHSQERARPKPGRAHALKAYGPARTPSDTAPQTTSGQNHQCQGETNPSAPARGAVLALNATTRLITKADHGAQPTRPLTTSHGRSATRRLRI